MHHIYPEVFTASNFNCVTSPGSLIPLDFIQQLLTIEHDPRRICELAREKGKNTCDGSVITSVMEFKMEGIKTDQTFAEMLCSLTNCSIYVLKMANRLVRQ